MEHSIARPVWSNTDLIVQSTARFAGGFGYEVDIVLPRGAGSVTAAREAADKSGVRLDVTLTADHLRLHFTPDVVARPAPVAEAGPGAPSQAVSRHGTEFASHVGRLARWVLGEPSVTDPSSGARLSAIEWSSRILLVAILANVQRGAVRLERLAGAMYLRPATWVDPDRTPLWPEGSWEAEVLRCLAGAGGPVPIGALVRSLVPRGGKPWQFVIDRAGTANGALEGGPGHSDPLVDWAKLLLTSYRTSRPSECNLLEHQLIVALETR